MLPPGPQRPPRAPSVGAPVSHAPGIRVSSWDGLFTCWPFRLFTCSFIHRIVSRFFPGTCWTLRTQGGFLSSWGSRSKCGRHTPRLSHSESVLYDRQPHVFSQPQLPGGRGDFLVGPGGWVGSKDGVLPGALQKFPRCDLVGPYTPVGILSPCPGVVTSTPFAPHTLL